MANVSVYNTEGQVVETMELNDAIFGVEVNEHLVHMAVVAQLANKRQGTQKAKTRAPGHPESKDPCRGFRRRKEALETERHRPRKTGLDQSSAVEGRRRCVRPDSP